MAKKGFKKGIKGKEHKEPLTAQEYEKLKLSAYNYVVVQGYTQRQASEMLGVSEVSMSAWSREGKWREQREIRQATARSDAENSRQIIRLLSKERLEIEDNIRQARQEGDATAELELRKCARGLSDEISKYNKVLQSLDKESRYTVEQFIHVMEDVFNALREYDKELYDRTISFQEYYARKRSIELS